MKTTTRLYDIIYSMYNHLYGDFIQNNIIPYYEVGFKFSHKVIDYDKEIQTVCRASIFYGLDFLGEARNDFEAEFLARFLSRTIKFQTYEVLNWRLASFTRGVKDLLIDYYAHSNEYLRGITTSTNESKDASTSTSTSRTNNIDVNLPQNNTDMSLDKETFDYADTTSHSKSKSDDSSNGSSNSKSESTSLDVGRLKQLKAFHDDFFEDLDRHLFSQML